MDVSVPGGRAMRRLTIGLPGRRRATPAVFGVIMLCGGLPVGGVVTMVALVLTGGLVSGETTPTAVALGWVAGLGFAAIVGFLVLRIVRSGFWLDGTVIIERGAITTRRVDLATAEVAGYAIAEPRRLINPSGTVVSEAVRARDRRTGVTIRIPIQTPGQGRLPSDELIAIADAIMTRRQPGDPGYPQAETLTQVLRRMAATPFPV